MCFPRKVDVTKVDKLTRMDETQAIEDFDPGLVDISASVPVEVSPEPIRCHWLLQPTNLRLAWRPGPLCKSSAMEDG